MPVIVFLLLFFSFPRLKKKNLNMFVNKYICRMTIGQCAKDKLSELEGI